MSNQNKELVDSFIQDVRPLLLALEAEIEETEKTYCKDGFFSFCLGIIHTIKGTAACLGMEKIVDFCHEYESFIKEIESGKIECDKRTIDILQGNLDSLKKACLYYSFGEIEKFDREIQVENEAIGFKNVCLINDNILIPVDNIEKIERLGLELITLHGAVAKLMGKNRSTNSEMIQKYIAELGAELLKNQRQITEMKKIPMSGILEPLQKFASGYGKNSNKKVEMRVQGEGLMVNFSTGKILSNVLVHIVNNSLIHGVECTNVRRKRGKQEKGTIDIRCYQKGDNLIVEVEDDGGGFDRDKIISRAISKKLLDGNMLKSVREEDLLNIVFEPDFSTLDKVTQIAGRGIGMSTVRTIVEKMNGKVELYNKGCRGSMVKIKIPVSNPIESVEVLNFKVLENHYGIPMKDVFEIISCNNGESGIVHELGFAWVLDYSNQLIPVVHLGEYLNVSKRDLADLENIVVIKNESYFYGLIVENIDEMQKAAVRKMKGTTQEQPCYLGAAVTKHGKVRIVLDVNKIAKECKLKKYNGNCGGIKKDNTILERYVLFDLNSHKNYVISLNEIFGIESVGVDSVEYTGSMAVIPYQNEKVSLVWVEKALNLCSGRTLKNYIAQCRSLNILFIRRGQKYFGLIVDEIKGIEQTPLEIDRTISDRKGILGAIVFDNKIASVLNIQFLLEDWSENYCLHEA